MVPVMFICGGSFFKTGTWGNSRVWGEGRKMRNELNKSEVVPGAPVETVPHALFGTSSGAIMVTGWKRLMDGFEGSLNS